MNNVSFDITPDEFTVVIKIAGRAVSGDSNLNFMKVEMDLTATHANGCPLRFDELLNADDFNFWHDIYGIADNINRDTGKLENFFFRDTHVTDTIAREH